MLILTLKPIRSKVDKSRQLAIERSKPLAIIYSPKTSIISSTIFQRQLVIYQVQPISGSYNCSLVLKALNCGLKPDLYVRYYQTLYISSKLLSRTYSTLLSYSQIDTISILVKRSVLKSPSNYLRQLILGTNYRYISVGDATLRSIYGRYIIASLLNPVIDSYTSIRICFIML